MKAAHAGYYFCALFISASCDTMAAEKYNTLFLHGIDAKSLADFISHDDEVLPGVYPVAIYVNDVQVDSQNVEFSRSPDDDKLQPCLTAKQYQQYGIKLPESSLPCYSLRKNVSGAQEALDIFRHRLDITIPQIYTHPVPQGYISPARYDDGINAAFVNYNFTADNNRSDISDQTYQYLSLNSGINVGAWRFRNNSYWNKSSNGTARWKTVSSWVETNIVPWQSHLLIGQASTPGEIFDSVPFRGVQLNSDNSMLPDSQNGYAPTIRGIANSNARVEVRQNTYLIYSTNVSPGPFEINDIYSVNRSGDFYVTIIEADGTKSTFTVAYTALPNLVRRGLWNYQLAAGKYYNANNAYAPAFIQSTVSHGLNDTFTLYGGVLNAENYTASALGVGTNLGAIGAFSADLTWADTALASGERKQGSSVRFLYAKSFRGSGTDFQIAGYRYSTSGYYDFSEAIAEHQRWGNGSYKNYYWEEQDPNDPEWAVRKPETFYTPSFNTKKERFDFSASQHLGEQTAFYLNFSQQNYWQNTDHDMSVQGGISSNIGRASYSIYYQNSRNHYSTHDDSVNFRISIPFYFKNQNNMTAYFSVNNSQSSGASATAGVNGTLLDDGRMSYAVETTYDRSSKSTNSASVGYQGQFANAYAGYSYNNSSQQTSLNLSGGLIAHQGGVTLSQPLGETFSLIEAKNAAGVSIENQPGVAIDRFGYAVLPHTIPWRVNTVALNTEDFGSRIDVPAAVADTVPTRGAITRITFETYKGESVLIHSKLADNSVPPLGATVFAADGRNSGLTGPDGDIFISGVSGGDKLQVKWGDAPEEQCQLTLPELNEDSSLAVSGYRELTLPCRQ